MSRILKAVLVCSAIGILNGCVVMPPEHRGYYTSDAITVAPPPVREEIIGVAPAPDYIWIGGYWGWNGNRHEWVQGHWSAPRSGYRWVPHRWEQEGSRWHLHEGHWEQHHDHEEHHERR